ncbi:MAG: biopolymer transport protein ExbB [Bacteroidetes bacterium]|nr:MAG: biopolymer transport protein ExbB [Bacteroidota bacterium]
MKKLIALLMIAGIMTIGYNSIVSAQDATGSAETTSVGMQTDEAAPRTFHEEMKERFIEGGPVWMAPILLTLIFGLAIAMERIIYLTLSGTNTTKLLNGIESALAKGGVEEAKKLCRDTRGPVASIFYQGLMRYDNGIEEVEKAVVSYGSVITGRMESGISWISLFIALAPMLGFLGTVVGMIQAFDDIAAAGDISPQIVANGIKIALLTTVFGLIVAIFLQILYNYIISKVDSLIGSMEDTSISFMDMMYKYTKK